MPSCRRDSCSQTLALLLCFAAVHAGAQTLPDALLLHRYEIDNAYCSDGSPAALLYRNCSGNWARLAVPEHAGV